MNQRDSYAKAMSGAYKSAEKSGTLGTGFGDKQKPIAPKVIAKPNAIIRALDNKKK